MPNRKITSDIIFRYVTEREVNGVARKQAIRLAFEDPSMPTEETQTLAVKIANRKEYKEHVKIMRGKSLLASEAQMMAAKTTWNELISKTIVSANSLIAEAEQGTFEQKSEAIKTSMTAIRTLHKMISEPPKKPAAEPEKPKPIDRSGFIS